MNVLTVKHPTQDIEVEAVDVIDDDTLREVRASDWHDGQLAFLTFKSGVVGYIAPENPKVFGAKVEVGDRILKGPAGDFEVITGGAA